jgi:DNA-binding response OmpR family regulator
MHLLLIEDEEKVARSIVKGLVAERFAVDVAFEGDKGLELAQIERKLIHTIRGVGYAIGIEESL